MNGEILEELSNGIVEIINSNIEKVILYGSFARGTNDKDSDVDIMVIVKNELDKFTEDKLSDFIVDMNLKYDKVFSVIDVNVHEFIKWADTLPFYKNVNREGIVLWTAA
ncbi:nucleotidyltransferase domain-containing protein [Catonella massiliensis]|jgi:nucleotidyltransferase domain|uniref:Nucleotidyltransferase domain-containing protein n=1 Tax=Catonella massiliensis TaxID=2799636 RepID=A0ABS1IX47_9FIRM|nr:nucleotidyltransferase domain-containing protein [Catonella massiliensis]MBK5896469.1 nucleotidyltransferase domain-containing protein [Catonella massiliensis]